MALDASFEVVTNVQHHPNADRLDTAEIGGYTVVVGRDQFKDGDTVFYIREDAQLVGDIAKWPWQANALKFASNSGRIKVVTLRGVTSAGLALPIEEVYKHISRQDARDWKKDNEKLTSEFPAAFLLGKFGIHHYEPPCSKDGESVGNLPWGLPKSDEENFQALKLDGQIPWGEKCLVTKKIDGSSMAICCAPDGEWHLCSRSNEKLKGADNNFSRAAKDVVDLGLAWAKHYNKRIVLRGELTAKNIQAFGFNKDKDINGGLPTFNLYGVFMPDEIDFHNRDGRYGTPYHFLEIAKQIKELTGIEIQTVPIIGEETLTKELFKSYTLKPKDWGEGIVANFYNGVGSCKSKSLDYLGKLSQVL